MNIGILQCDEVDIDLIAVHGTCPEMYKRLLNLVGPTLNLTVYDIRKHEFPTHINEVDAYLITGSRHGVHDNFTWISALEDFIRCLHEARKKTIGICFGHQLIAKALGGKVIKSTKGWGIGMSTNKIIHHSSWMLPFLEELNLIMSHQDQVVTLPQDATLLATSDFCPFYMLQIDEHFFTVQGHPEFSKTYFQALIENRKQKVGKELYEKGLKSLQIKSDGEVFSRWIVNFLFDKDTRDA